MVKRPGGANGQILDIGGRDMIGAVMAPDLVEKTR